MKKFCSSEPTKCCEAAAYWREMSYADAARNQLLEERCETLREIVQELRSKLKGRDRELERIAHLKRPVASERSYGEMRRRA